MKVLFCVFIPVFVIVSTQQVRDISQVLKCPEIVDGDNLTQSDFTTRLTADCRYDKLIRPTEVDGPLNVSAQMYIYHLESASSHDLMLSPFYKRVVHASVVLIEATELDTQYFSPKPLKPKTNLINNQELLDIFGYVDIRLAYRELSPRRTSILGESLLRDKIWVPHVFLTNERESSLMGSGTKDVLVSVSPDGEVIYSTRLTATLYCWMNLKKFPFDEQDCSIDFESWTYNTSELQLKWEEKNPVTLGKQLHLTEFSLLNYWTNTSEVHASSMNQRHGAFVGNYSKISFTFHLNREIGFYLLDYFIPSMMCVAISWVSFWLQADNSAPRIMLGTSTMLSFITLASAQGKNLPRVSYIKASEIWFLGCTGFIFGSLVEFAFVNTIWRRKQNVELKKVNSKYILKSTLTPKLHRKELQKFGSTNSLQKSRSCSSLEEATTNPNGSTKSFNNYLTVHSLPSQNHLPIITTQSYDELVGSNSKDSKESVSIQINSNDSVNKQGQSSTFHGWTTMTPQEISQWIDRRSRLLFPCAFFFFNLLYWGFVYAF